MFCGFALLRYAKVSKLTKVCAEQGKTVLMFAIENGLEDLSNKLIEMGAEFHANLKDDAVVPVPCLQEVLRCENKLT